MAGLVPDEILQRRDKIGFATPEKRWLAALRPQMEEALGSSTAEGIGALRIDAMRRHWQNALAGSGRFDFRFWRWLNLIRWAERREVRFE